MVGRSSGDSFEESKPTFRGSFNHCWHGSPLNGHQPPPPFYPDSLKVQSHLSCGHGCFLQELVRYYTKVVENLKMLHNLNLSLMFPSHHCHDTNPSGMAACRLFAYDPNSVNDKRVGGNGTCEVFPSKVKLLQIQSERSPNQEMLPLKSQVK
eukprot:Gb_29344 [translate_table: standard]